MTRERYAACDGDAEVTRYTIHAGGHTWSAGTGVNGTTPAGAVPRGPTSTAVRATAVVLDFFAAHRRQ